MIRTHLTADKQAKLFLNSVSISLKNWTIQYEISDSAVCFKYFSQWWMCSPIKGFYLIVTLKAIRDLRNFRFWLRDVRFDSPVHSAHLVTILLKLFIGDSVLGNTARCRTPRCLTLHGVWLCTVQYSLEFILTLTYIHQAESQNYIFRKSKMDYNTMRSHPPSGITHLGILQVYMCIVH